MQAIEVHSKSGMVVGPGQAVSAGLEMLREGGNAIDAAIAMALAAGVVAPARCGLAGYGGVLVAYLADEGRVACLEFAAEAPGAARPEMFPPGGGSPYGFGAGTPGAEATVGYRAVAVPGTPAGLAWAVDALGALSFSRTVAPAIRLARDGFPASPGYVADLRAAREVIESFPESAEWLLPGGRLPEIGDPVANQAHACFLERLASEGIEAFYRGEVADAIARHVRGNGGILTAEDLAAYQPRQPEPLAVPFLDYTLCTAPLPSGGPTVAQALRILDGLDLGRLWMETLPYYHAIALVLQRVWADRMSLLGDPAFVPAPLERLLADEYAAQERHRIEHLVHDSRVLHGPEVVGLPGGTVHLEAADARGNRASLTLTHGAPFGTCVSLPGSGTLLGGGMDCFDPVPGRPNSIAPRKRPLHPMSPVLLLRDGRPILSLGAVGGRKALSAVAQTLVHFCALHQREGEAICLPRLHTEGSTELLAEDDLPRPACDYLRAVGYEVASGGVGAVHAIRRDEDAGLTIGVADPRTSGLAVAP